MNSAKRHVLLIMSVLLFTGVMGCGRASSSAAHEVSEIVSVSISCGNMDIRYGYAFFAERAKNGWLLDAECFTEGFEVETKLVDKELGVEDVEELLSIIESNGLIGRAENYRKAKRSPAADAAAYGFAMRFSDDTQYVMYEEQRELTEFFYRAAEKYN